MMDAAPVYTEVWTVDETQQQKWNDFLAENGVSIDYLQNVLTAHHAARIQFGSILPEAPQYDTKDVQEKTLQLLWGNEVVEVYLPPKPRLLHHLWVVLKRPIESSSDVGEEEHLALRRVVKKIQTVLREQFTSSTFIAHWNQPQTTYFPKRFTIEVIPPRPESRKVFNVWDKMECMNYFYWRDRFPSFLPTPTESEMEDMTIFWKAALQEPPSVFSDCLYNESVDQPSIPVVREAESIKVLRDAIFHLVKQRLSIMREETKELIEPPNTLLQGKSTCVFCSEEILKAESVYESKLFYVLYNYKTPSSAHFLIIPKRHVKSSENLREDEWREFHTLSRLLIEMLQETENRSDVLFYTQEDASVAQKVPHTHTHVVLSPSPLRYFVFSMNYMKEPALTRKELEPVLQKFRMRIQQTIEKRGA